jgi:hypothetical protein
MRRNKAHLAHVILMLSPPFEEAARALATNAICTDACDGVKQAHKFSMLSIRSMYLCCSNRSQQYMCVTLFVPQWPIVF